MDPESSHPYLASGSHCLTVPRLSFCMENILLTHCLLFCWGPSAQRATEPRPGGASTVVGQVVPLHPGLQDLLLRLVQKQGRGGKQVRQLQNARLQSTAISHISPASLHPVPFHTQQRPIWLSAHHFTTEAPSWPRRKDLPAASSTSSSSSSVQAESEATEESQRLVKGKKHHGDK